MSAKRRQVKDDQKFIVELEEQQEFYASLAPRLYVDQGVGDIGVGDNALPANPYPLSIVTTRGSWINNEFHLPGSSFSVFNHGLRVYYSKTEPSPNMAKGLGRDPHLPSDKHGDLVSGSKDDHKLDNVDHGSAEPGNNDSKEKPSAVVSKKEKASSAAKTMETELQCPTEIESGQVVNPRRSLRMRKGYGSTPKAGNEYEIREVSDNIGGRMKVNLAEPDSQTERVEVNEEGHPNNKNKNRRTRRSFVRTNESENFDNGETNPPNGVLDVQMDATVSIKQEQTDEEDRLLAIQLFQEEKASRFRPKRSSVNYRDAQAQIPEDWRTKKIKDEPDERVDYDNAYGSSSAQPSPPGRSGAAARRSPRSCVTTTISNRKSTNDGGARNIACDQCGKMLAHFTSLKRHKKIVHSIGLATTPNHETSISGDGGDKTTCDLCGKSLAHAGSLKRHKKFVHSV